MTKLARQSTNKVVLLALASDGAHAKHVDKRMPTLADFWTSLDKIRESELSNIRGNLYAWLQPMPKPILK